MNPLASWWFYVPFILLISAAISAAIIDSVQVDKHKDTAQSGALAAPAGISHLDTLIGLVIIVTLTWSLINIARYLIYIIPFSGPVISSPYFALPTITIALLLYRLRGTYPLYYGSTEVLVAILAIFVSIGTDTTNPLNKIVGILGGAYILIRGLDNMDKGLPISWRAWWDKWFPKKHPTQETPAPQ